MRAHVRQSLRAVCVSLVASLPLPVLACEGDAFEALTKLVGHWDVFRDGVRVGEFRLSEAAGGCALIEQSTLEGRSAAGLHWLEPAEDGEEDGATVLRQVYVESNGWFIHAEGEIIDNALVYVGEAKWDGEPVTLRATLQGIGSDEITHISDASTDDGESWNYVSTLTYRRNLETQ